ncbi:MAG TPA: hypothetical protein VLT17_06195 [Gemmatimonadales bacterium]|nr:hypothetical protein [Gemmatimonadales bacterium]
MATAGAAAATGAAGSISLVTGKTAAQTWHRARTPPPGTLAGSTR